MTLKFDVTGNSVLLFVGWVLFVLGIVILAFSFTTILTSLLAEDKDIFSLMGLGTSAFGLVASCLFLITGSLSIIAGKMK